MQTVALGNHFRTFKAQCKKPHPSRSLYDPISPQVSTQFPMLTLQMIRQTRTMSLAKTGNNRVSVLLCFQISIYVEIEILGDKCKKFFTLHSYYQDHLSSEGKENGTSCLYIKIFIHTLKKQRSHDTINANK